MNKRGAALLRVRAAVAVLFAAVLLAACQTASPTVRPYALGKEDIIFFKRLVIAPVPAARPSYGVVAGCSYRSLGAAPGRGTQGEISVIRAKDRLLVRIAGDRTLSTALIGSDGTLFDFNLAGFAAPATPDTYGALARQSAAALRPRYGAEAHVVNDLALILPHYAGGPMKPGDAVSVITDENGQPWARYVYRGVSRYEGREVFVLDLLRRSGAKPAERTIGFNLVDRARAIPALLVVESARKIHLQQLRCR